VRELVGFVCIFAASLSASWFGKGFSIATREWFKRHDTKHELDDDGLKSIQHVTWVLSIIVMVFAIAQLIEALQ
jgi:hypothetical protein